MRRRSFIQTIAAVMIVPAMILRVPTHWGRLSEAVAQKTCTFIGSTFGRWSEPKNWRDGIFPKSGDDVVIPFDRGRTVQDIPALSLNSITISQGSAVCWPGPFEPDRIFC